MKVLVWEIPDTHCFAIVLWDGDFTYWSDEMSPSSGYKKSQERLEEICLLTDSKFTVIGDL